MSDADVLRGRWSTAAWSELRARVIARGSIEDAPLPTGPWEHGWPHDLRGIDLARQRLVGLDLLELDFASFRHAYLQRCWISSGSLTQADFTESQVEDGGVLCSSGTAVVFEHALITRVDLGSTILTQSRLGAARFVRCSLVAARLFTCDLRRTRFINCDLNSAKFTGSTLDGAVFEDCDLGYTDLRGVSLRGARLLRCDMEGAEWAGADLTDADVKTSMVRF